MFPLLDILISSCDALTVSYAKIFMLPKLNIAIENL
jgi:hypothetical protein